MSNKTNFDFIVYFCNMIKVNNLFIYKALFFYIMFRFNLSLYTFEQNTTFKP
ncbi:hypothetical protein NUSPORA_00994 [Nucleospora cyclopteri]